MSLCKKISADHAATPEPTNSSVPDAHGRPIKSPEKQDFTSSSDSIISSTPPDPSPIRDDLIVNQRTIEAVETLIRSSSIASAATNSLLTTLIADLQKVTTKADTALNEVKQELVDLKAKQAEDAIKNRQSEEALKSTFRNEMTEQKQTITTALTDLEKRSHKARREERKLTKSAIVGFRVWKIPSHTRKNLLNCSQHLKDVIGVLERCAYKQVVGYIIFHDGESKDRKIADLYNALKLNFQLDDKRDWAVITDNDIISKKLNSLHDKNNVTIANQSPAKYIYRVLQGYCVKLIVRGAYENEENKEFEEFMRAAERQLLAERTDSDTDNDVKHSSIPPVRRSSHPSRPSSRPSSKDKSPPPTALFLPGDEGYSSVDSDTERDRSDSISSEMSYDFPNMDFYNPPTVNKNSADQLSNKLRHDVVVDSSGCFKTVRGFDL